MTTVHPNLKQISHSALSTLHACPRKFELEKLQTSSHGWGDTHFDFGHVVGEGLQNFFLTNGDVKDTLFKMFMRWQSDIDEDSADRSKANKTFWHALHAIERFVPYSTSVFANHELAYFNNRPAVELGFCIDCGDGYAYRGFVDLVLVNKMTGRLVAVENKTTSSWNLSEAQYKNSGQGLGYSLMLDVVASAMGLPVVSDHPVFYPVYKTKDFDWEVFQFIKSRTSRAKWIKNLMMDKTMLQLYNDNDFFPMHGESCRDFNRDCAFFGVCEMSNESLVGSEPEVREEPADKYDFYFSLEDIIDEQLKQLEG